MKRYLILVASCLVSASTLADQVLGEVEDKYVTKVRNSSDDGAVQTGQSANLCRPRE